MKVTGKEIIMNEDLLEKVLRDHRELQYRLSEKKDISIKEVSLVKSDRSYMEGSIIYRLGYFGIGGLIRYDSIRRLWVIEKEDISDVGEGWEFKYEEEAKELLTKRIVRHVNNKVIDALTTLQRFTNINESFQLLMPGLERPYKVEGGDT